jgi:hypothetical protein
MRSGLHLVLIGFGAIAISEMNATCLVLFGMNSSIRGSYFAAIHRILVLVSAVMSGLHGLQKPSACTATGGSGFGVNPKLLCFVGEAAESQ